MDVLVACWSVKGGSGTTVVSVALATLLARSSSGGALLVDLGAAAQGGVGPGGDVPAVLGLPEPTGPGLGEWLSTGDAVPADALARLEIHGPGGLHVLASGAMPLGACGRAEVLAAVLAADPRPVIADCGSLAVGPGLAVAAAASVSLLVLRPCYLSLRRALQAPLRPSGVILVSDAGRSLGQSDVEDVLGVAVRAVIAVDPAVARAVDAGLLPARLPRGLERALRHAA